MRRLLVDTHVLLWWLMDSDSLGVKAKSLIANSKNIVFVSAATAWEISIKKSLGKLDAPDDMEEIILQEGFSPLPITLFHGQQAGALPSLHRDPFDRMLVAQAQAEGLAILSADKVLNNYGIKVIDACV